MLSPKDIRIELLRAGISQAEIARTLGVSKQYVCMVINGERSPVAVRAGVAKAIDKSYLEVWGEEGPEVTPSVNVSTDDTTEAAA